MLVLFEIDFGSKNSFELIKQYNCTGLLSLKLTSRRFKLNKRVANVVVCVGLPASCNAVSHRKENEAWIIKFQFQKIEII